MKAIMPRDVEVLTFLHSNSSAEHTAINLGTHKIGDFGSYIGRRYSNRR